LTNSPNSKGALISDIYTYAIINGHISEYRESPIGAVFGSLQLTRITPYSEQRSPPKVGATYIPLSAKRTLT
jgi:hypothetical protein